MTKTFRTLSTAAVLAVGALLPGAHTAVAAESPVSAGPVTSEGVAGAAQTGLEVLRTCGLPTVADPSSIVQNCTDGSLAR
ncbi:MULTISPECIES: hypothetical protein [unclassified Streptomyces]|jgi:hypothetical protein|uniref:hypothetical protein n=1 Tax=unclassified Streptomyces TaxID=2593676 RepID=UPI0036557B6F